MKKTDYKICHYDGTYWHVSKTTGTDRLIAAFKNKEHAEMFISFIKAKEEIWKKIKKELE